MTVTVTGTNPLQRAPLALYIRESGLTIKEVADQMGVTRMRLHQIIRDPSRMRVEQVVRLSHIIKVPLCTLVTVAGRDRS